METQNGLLVQWLWAVGSNKVRNETKSRGKRIIIGVAVAFIFRFLLIASEAQVLNTRPPGCIWPTPCFYPEAVPSSRLTGKEQLHF